jgi:hypothetical protein
VDAQPSAWLMGDAWRALGQAQAPSGLGRQLALARAGAGTHPHDRQRPGDTEQSARATFCVGIIQQHRRLTDLRSHRKRQYRYSACTRPEVDAVAVDEVLYAGVSFRDAP